MDVTSSIFRAYDIRGVVKTDLRPDVVLLIGKAIGTLYPDCKKVAVGRDGRLTSKELSDNLIEGLRATGIDVVDIGEVHIGRGLLEAARRLADDLRIGV